MNLRRRRLWAALESHCKHNTRRLSKGIGKAPAVAANFASALRRRSGPRGYFGQHLCSPLSLGSVLLACWIPILRILLRRSLYLSLRMHCNASCTAWLSNRPIEHLSTCSKRDVASRLDISLTCSPLGGARLLRTAGRSCSSRLFPRHPLGHYPGLPITVGHDSSAGKADVSSSTCE